jgi:hypothetical protein
VQVSGSYDARHCHGLSGIAGYIVVRTRPGRAAEGGQGETHTDLAVLEGAWKYPHARWPCCMPGSPGSPASATISA